MTNDYEIQLELDMLPDIDKASKISMWLLNNNYNFKDLNYSQLKNNYEGLLVEINILPQKDEHKIHTSLEKRTKEGVSDSRTCMYNFFNASKYITLGINSNKANLHYKEPGLLHVHCVYVDNY